MITQFDHLTLYTKDLAAHRTILESLGYKLRFQATPNNPQIKKPLVEHFSPTHKLALFDLPGSLSIELIEESQPSGYSSCIVPIFENVPEKHVEHVGTAMRFGSLDVHEAKLKGLEAPVFVTKGAGSVKFTSYALMTNDIAANAAVWKALGWKQVTDAQFTFASPIHGFASDLFLANAVIQTPVKLDCEGFNYVALVSTSAKKERERLMKAGLEVTELEEHRVNGKVLDLFFITGKNVQPTEVLGLHS